MMLSLTRTYRSTTGMIQQAPRVLANPSLATILSVSSAVSSMPASLNPSLNFGSCTLASVTCKCRSEQLGNTAPGQYGRTHYAAGRYLI